MEDIQQGKGLVGLSDGRSLPYDILVFATGASAFIPPIPGIDQTGVFSVKHLSDGLAIKNFLEKEKCRKAVIIGGGFIGMEMCEVLHNRGIDTRVIDLTDRPVMRWEPEFTDLIVDEMARHDVQFMPGTKTQAVEKGKEHRFRLITNEGELDADIIIAAVGIRPATDLAKAMGIETGRNGAIQVNFSQQTSKENVYAVGDCCEVYHRIMKKWVYQPLGDISNKQGRVAGINIGGASMLFPGVIGAQSFKLFDLEVAATGIDTQEAVAAGFKPACTIHWGKASAFPDAPRIGLKLVADRSSGLLLGAQGIGTSGVVGRINVLSTALWAGMHLQDIAYMDLAYSPYYSPPWDPIHFAAQQLMRQMQSSAVGACSIN